MYRFPFPNHGYFYARTVFIARVYLFIIFIITATLKLNAEAAQRFINHALNDIMVDSNNNEKENKEPENDRNKKENKGKSKEDQKDKQKNKSKEETPKNNKRQSPDKVTENTDKKKRRK